MIVGTAGHIDHGKTALVKALTGVDTDRLKEEKARGISIELGYAYLPVPEDDRSVLAFVDVPGHEKFVHNMVAGATGIDFALLVVAADDGPMPQTAEHLDILQLIGVGKGLVAMTKVDRCDPVRRAECEDEIRALLQATPLADEPILQVSSITGEGLDALRDHLVEAARTHKEQRRRGMGFRLAVDRCFTLDGAGTVVTGTVFAGEIGVGDSVCVTPSGMTARVRSIHAQNRPASVGRAGERCALALAGPDKQSIARGDWIVAPQLHAPTQRFDAKLALSRREPHALRNGAAVHLHLGAAHVLARVALLDTEELAPGAECLAQIVAQQPIGTLAGDAFVLRDAAAMRTLGGGRVLDPFAPVRKRKSAARIEVLRLMNEPDPTRRIGTLLEHSGHGLDLAAFCLGANHAVDELRLDPSVVRVRDGATDHAFSRASWTAFSTRLLGELAKFHAESPDQLGADLGRIRRLWFPQLEPAVVEALAKGLSVERRLARTGPWWHLPGAGLTFSERDRTLAQRILPLLDAGAFDPPWVRDLSGHLKTGEQEVRVLLNRLARRGDVYQVVKDLFYSRSAITQLAMHARALQDAAGVVRAAEFRDRIRLGRKRAIQILEFFDRIGYTRRTNDEHRIRSDSLLKLEGDGRSVGVRT